MPDAEKPVSVLMHRDNPDGWKLEDLARKLRQEIHIKQSKIKDDARPEARRVHLNNAVILTHLEEIERLQKDSMDTVAKLGPNQGPQGTPRIGEGSPGHP